MRVSTGVTFVDKLTNVGILRISHTKDENQKSCFTLRFLSTINGEVRDITTNVAWALPIELNKHLLACYTGYLSELEIKIKEKFPGVITKQVE